MITIEFGRLTIGDLFWFNGERYKVIEEVDDYNAIHVKSGKRVLFLSNEPVRIPDAKKGMF